MMMGAFAPAAVDVAGALNALLLGALWALAGAAGLYVTLHASRRSAARRAHRRSGGLA